MGRGWLRWGGNPHQRHGPPRHVLLCPCQSWYIHLCGNKVSTSNALTRTDSMAWCGQSSFDCPLVLLPTATWCRPYRMTRPPTQGGQYWGVHQVICLWEKYKETPVKKFFPYPMPFKINGTCQYKHITTLAHCSCVKRPSLVWSVLPVGSRLRAFFAMPFFVSRGSWWSSLVLQIVNNSWHCGWNSKALIWFHGRACVGVNLRMLIGTVSSAMWSLIAHPFKEMNRVLHSLIKLLDV